MLLECDETHNLLFPSPVVSFSGREGSVFDILNFEVFGFVGDYRCSECDETQNLYY